MCTNKYNIYIISHTDKARGWFQPEDPRIVLPTHLIASLPARSFSVKMTLNHHLSMKKNIFYVYYNKPDRQKLKPFLVSDRDSLLYFKKGKYAYNHIRFLRNFPTNISERIYGAENKLLKSSTMIRSICGGAIPHIWLIYLMRFWCLSQKSPNNTVTPQSMIVHIYTGNWPVVQGFYQLSSKK